MSALNVQCVHLFIYLFMFQHRRRGACLLKMGLVVQNLDRMCHISKQRKYICNHCVFLLILWQCLFFFSSLPSISSDNVLQSQTSQ